MKISKALRCPNCHKNTLKYRNSWTMFCAGWIICTKCARKQTKFIKITGIQ